MRQSWWKLLAVALLVYALVAGLLVPLKPNVVSVVPRAAAAGSTQTFTLLGYNTRFTQDGTHPRLWLTTGEEGQLQTLEATDVEVTDDRALRATFDLPAALPDGSSGGRDLNLIVSGATTGTFVAPGMVRFSGEGAGTATGTDAWRVNGIGKGDLVANTAFTFPYRGLLAETIRNTYFHVSLWFAMMFLYIAGVVYAIRYLRLQSKFSSGRLTLETDLTTVTRLERADYRAVTFTAVGTLFGVLGLLTGAVWAKYTWGSFWSWDIKQFTTLIALLIYGGYFVLRAAFGDPEQRARLSGAYNVFAFACLIPLIYILPRLSATSLHPGAEGNPAMGGEDLDNTMRMIFYPTIIGWTLFGGWMAGLAYRSRVAGEKLLRAREARG